MRQYGAQRRRGGANPLGVGVIAVGSIYYVQDDAYFCGRHARGQAVCKEPWTVEAFLNGMLHASRRNRDTGLWENTHASGHSDMAVVRSLRGGRRRTVAVHLLLLHDDLGLTKGFTGYPTLPDMRLYRRRPHVAPPAPVPGLDRAA